MRGNEESRKTSLDRDLVPRNVTASHPQVVLRSDIFRYGIATVRILFSFSSGIPTHCHCSLVCLVDSSIFERVFRASRSEAVFFCWRMKHCFFFCCLC